MTENVADLPVQVLPQVPRHVFAKEVWVAANRQLARHAQTERTCVVCGVVKVTVHGPDGGGWREWRLPGCKPQFSDALGAPPCKPSTVEAA